MSFDSTQALKEPLNPPIQESPPMPDESRNSVVSEEERVGSGCCGEPIIEKEIVSAFGEVPKKEKPQKWLDEPDWKITQNHSSRKIIELSPTCTVEVEVVFDKPVCFWARPEVRQSWSEKELHGELEVSATWDELFFDLVIVASIGQIASCLRWNEDDGGGEHRALALTEEDDGAEEDCSHAMIILHFALQMLSVYHVWAAVTQFNSRLKTNSISHTLRLILKMVAIAGMGANSEINLGSLSQFFAFVSFAWFMEFTSTLEVVLCGLKDERTRPYLRQTCNFGAVIFIPVIVFAILSWWASTSTTDDLNGIYTFWVLFFFFGPCQSPTTYTMFLGRFLTKLGFYEPFNQREQGIPMNVLYITERFGLFQIIVIGETVIAGSAGFTDFFNNSSHQQLACIMSLVLAVQTKLLYYELQAEQKTHALRVSKMSGFAFFLAHSILFVCLVGMGSLLHDVSAGLVWDVDQRRLFALFSGTFLYAISGLAVAHEGVGRGLRLLRKEIRIGTRLLIGSILITIGLLDGCHVFTDVENIVVVSVLYFLDFAIEFQGSKFSKKACGCEGAKEAPCLQRIISERKDLLRQQSAAVNPLMDGDRGAGLSSTNTSIDSVGRQTGGPRLSFT
ncbi:hypothetical protein TrVE_jg1319 [Triparma verrucosa]|uniref:Uncharacterized protein n=1 Tax=Triparma verrucosa TaxID=1606542 RepID=A0A9W7KRV1_9STRA|nr:hypothetical protein TrVE_jg1319 [Triparma verrucosa]